MSRFIDNSSSCIAKVLSISLVACLNVIKKHVMIYCETVGERNGKNIFWSIKSSDEILNKQANSKKICLHHLLFVF